MYSAKRRQDPEYRRMEAEKRRERRQKLREARNSLTGQVKQRTSQRVSKPRTTRQQQPTKDTIFDISKDSQDTRSSVNDVDILCPSEDEDSQNSMKDVSLVASPLRPNSTVREDIPKSQSTETPVSVRKTENHYQRVQGSCSCMTSNAMARLAHLARELSVFDRQRLEYF